MMKKVLFLTCLLCSGAWADSVLTKSALEKYFVASPKLEAEIRKHPDLSEEHIQKLPFEDGGRALVKYLSKSEGYDELQAIAKQSGFKSLESYVAVAYALIPALYAVQKELYPDIPTVEEQRKLLQAQKKQLVEQGASGDLVAKAIGTAEASLARQEEIERAAATVSKEDVKVIRSNLEWVMKKMEAAAEG